MSHRVIYVLIIALLPALGLSPAIGAQEPTPSQESRHDRTDDERQSGLESPQATIRTFFESMRAFKAGNEAKLLEAVNCLYLGDDLPPDEQLNRGSGPALTIFSVVDGLQFDMASITAEPAGDDYTAVIGTGESAVELYLHRYEHDGWWRISSKTLEPDYLAELSAIAATQAEATEEVAVTFVPRLQSPRATMETFYKGMMGVDGFTRADAILTLDLSEVNAVDRATVGQRQAADLKAILDRVKPVELSQIPPESDGETFVYFQDPGGAGSIVLSPGPDFTNPELKAWRFTRSTLAGLETLYLAYKDRLPVQGQEDGPDSRPWANRIRDWVHASYPSLMHEPFYLRNYQWVGLLVLIGLGIVISRLLTLFLGVFIQFWFRRKGFAYDPRLEVDFIRPIRIALMAWVWLYGLTLLGLHPLVLQYLRVAAFFVTAVGSVWASYRLVDIVGKYLTEQALRSESKHDDLLVPIVVRTLKVFIIVAGIVAFAYQVSANPAGLLTGLGLGGLAFALAAKDVVANVFGSITILLDRPFRIGDWVTMGEIDGSVESVGIRSTRIRTFYNSLITVPNSAITNTHVDNMGCRRYRRIKATLGITYDTPPESIEAFCEGIRELIRQHPYTRKDYFHVYLNGFNQSSLDILLYCFVETPEWGTELREKHRLFLDVIRLAQALDISFAFPTQTLFLGAEGASSTDEVPTNPQETGRSAASGIIKQTLGGRGHVPPPVTFDIGGDNDHLLSGEDSV